MPEAGQQPDDHDVDDLSFQTMAVAAERNIDIVTEPVGQGHVPAPPEISDGAGNVRVIEVLKEIKAEHLAKTDCHIGIAAEVKIDLEGIA